MPRLVSGFTLIETLVAVSIFTMSILALLVVLTQGIANNNYAKKKMVASYLAQEGIEYARNMRDTFVLFDPTDSQTGWDAFKTKVSGLGATVCAQANGCYFGDLSSADYINPSQPMAGLTVTECGSTCPPLLYDESIGKYSYISGDNSGFIRKIGVEVVSANEMQISSTVYWTQGSGDYDVVFSENLYNWIE